MERTEKTIYLFYDKLNDNHFFVKLTDEQMDAIRWFMEKTDISDDYNWMAFSHVKIEEV